MFGIQYQDILTVIMLTLLEGILSVDNAVVLAIIVQPLPEEQRRKALNIGVLAAMIFASFLLQFWIFKAVGAVYLIYLSAKHLFMGGAEQHALQLPGNVKNQFMKIVGMLIFTDFVFSIDSITTAIVFSDKLWVLWFGGVMGIILMRFLSGFFVKAIERFPKMEDLAYQLVFFVGIKQGIESLGVEIEKWVFWVMMGIIILIGVAMVIREDRTHKHSVKLGNELVKMIKEGKITVKDALERHAEDGRILAYMYKEGYLKELDK